ncbi:heterokaryon incompatibility protein [Rutstroemia sp. NJR-2017a WRK4]|nr:heterokaryon incompatibility protein [Rutstroemia sp. NJR-2017a WRK4]
MDRDKSISRTAEVLCSKCQSALDNEFKIKPGVFRSDSFDHHNTFPEVLAAVKLGCFICERMFSLASVKHQTRPHTVGTDDARFGTYAWTKLDHQPYCLEINWCWERTTTAVTSSLYEFAFFPAEDAKVLSLSSHLGPSTSSPTTTDTVKKWIADCERNHPKCGAAQGDFDFMPTRVLDIGNQGSDKLRLIHSNTGDMPIGSRNYIALSYVWGDSIPFKLTTSTIEKLKEGVPISELPQTFKDCVALARQLSIRYIWIDSLCIIQDSADDWEVESLNMRAIYSNSYCTVAAAASTNADGGLFRDRSIDDLRYGTAPSAWFQKVQNTTGQLNFLERSTWNQQLKRCPIFNRGWCVQERLLPHRVLYFTDHQVLWQCDSKLSCEAFPDVMPDLYGSHWYVPESGNVPKTSLGYSPPTKGILDEQLARWWHRIMEDYSDCMLSYPSDKLIAIAGIAELFQKLTGDQFVAGLWKSSILETLTWRLAHTSRGIAKRPASYRAPTWSWASLNEAVTPLLIAGRNGSLGLDTLTYRATVLDLHIENKDHNPLSEILCASITLRAPAVRHKCDKLDPFPELMRINAMYHSCQTFKCVLQFDTQEDFDVTSDEIVLLPIRTMATKMWTPVAYFKNASLQGLVLRPIVGRPGEYTRVGRLEGFGESEEGGMEHFGYKLERDEWVLDEKAELETFKIL